MFNFIPSPDSISQLTFAISAGSSGSNGCMATIFTSFFSRSSNRQSPASNQESRCYITPSHHAAPNPRIKYPSTPSQAPDFGQPSYPDSFGGIDSRARSQRPGGAHLQRQRSLALALGVLHSAHACYATVQIVWRAAVRRRAASGVVPRVPLSDAAPGLGTVGLGSLSWRTAGRWEIAGRIVLDFAKSSSLQSVV